MSIDKIEWILEIASARKALYNPDPVIRAQSGITDVRNVSCFQKHALEIFTPYFGRKCRVQHPQPDKPSHTNYCSIGWFYRLEFATDIPGEPGYLAVATSIQIKEVPIEENETHFLKYFGSVNVAVRIPLSEVISIGFMGNENQRLRGKYETLVV